MPLSSEMVSAGVQSHRAGAINGSIATGLTASGTSSQANSYAVTTSVALFTTVSATNGARLPVGAKNDVIVIRNGGANALEIYPPTGGKINGGSANAKMTSDLATSTTMSFKCTTNDGKEWFSY